MTLWMLLAAMTGAAVMSVLWPLSRRAMATPRAASEIGFYRDQMDEIVRDEARGILTGPEIASARAEAARRLLRSGAAADASLAPGASTGEPALRRRRAASAIGLSLVPLLALAVYGALGSPDLPALPIAARIEADPAKLDFATAMARIEQHLAAEPDDGRGWDVVAPLYLRLQRFTDADKAYSAAIRLGGANPPRLTGRGEAMAGANGGVINAETREIFERALALDPGSLKARFYLGIAAEQDGDAARATGLYQGVMADSPADAPWLPILREKLAALGAPVPATQALPPEIRAMVDGLDARLRASGGTPDEWTRLIRSYVVLGERDKAQDALARGRAALGAAQATDLTDAARALGLEAAR